MDELEGSTWGALHAGDVVQGSDGLAWGVVGVGHDATPRFSVQLYRLGAAVVGYPHPDTPVLVIRRADTRAEEAAWSVLTDAGLQPTVISETWET